MSAVFIKKIQKTGFDTKNVGEGGNVLVVFCDDLELLNLSHDTGKGVTIQHHDRPSSETSGKDGGQEN